jgi:hypothetical protein
MVVREWLHMQQPDLYDEGIFKLVPKFGQIHHCATSDDTSVQWVGYN